MSIEDLALAEGRAYLATIRHAAGHGGKNWRPGDSELGHELLVRWRAAQAALRCAVLARLEAEAEAEAFMRAVEDFHTAIEDDK